MYPLEMREVVEFQPSFHIQDIWTHITIIPSENVFGLTRAIPNVMRNVNRYVIHLYVQQNVYMVLLVGNIFEMQLLLMLRGSVMPTNNNIQWYIYQFYSSVAVVSVCENQSCFGIVVIWSRVYVFSLRSETDMLYLCYVSLLELQNQVTALLAYFKQLNKFKGVLYVKLSPR